MELEQLKSALNCILVLKFSLAIVYLCGILSFLLSVVTYEIWFSPVVVGACALAYLIESYAMKMLIESDFFEHLANAIQEIDND